MIDFDFSDVTKLAADLSGVPAEANRNVEKAVKVTAINVKDDWRQGADRSGLSGYARDVSFDMKYGAGEIGAEVGPTPGDSGSFGLVEDAKGDVRSAPQKAGRDAAKANEADFVRGILIAATEPLE